MNNKNSPNLPYLFNILFVFLLVIVLGAGLYFIINHLLASGASELESELGEAATTVPAVMDSNVPINVIHGTPSLSDSTETATHLTGTEEHEPTVTGFDAHITIHPVMVSNYLANPGIGWQHDEGSSSAAFLPEMVAYGARAQISWLDLNPGEGQYTWAALDQQLEQAVAAGKQFSFRVMTMAGEGYGGHEVPAWVLEKGAHILPSGEPDYSNCTYQQEWGQFVTALIARYDGNSDIAYIDVSGYGNFSEWSWQSQTQWDHVWEQSYANGLANAATMSRVDSYARRRLADIFIGGSYAAHECRGANGEIRRINYDYPGFQQTQLVMPYAGIAQTTQYVFVRRPDVGFSFDCLGRETMEDIMDAAGTEISQIWPIAPVVYELCGPGSVNLSRAVNLLEASHGSLVHDNGTKLNQQEITALVRLAGYRYFLQEAQLPEVLHPEQEYVISLVWQNLGYAPSYPRMGQEFQVHFYLANEADEIVADFLVDANASGWLPAECWMESAPTNELRHRISLPAGFEPGTYFAKVALIDVRTGLPILLAMEGQDEYGGYILAEVDVVYP